MKLSLVAVLLFSVQLCAAQFFEIRYVRDSTHKFVEVHSRDRAAVARKINQAIQKDWGYDPTSKNPFENLVNSEEADFYFEVGANNVRMLSVTITSSYASCGLHVNRKVYVFDAHTGNAIDVGKFFDAEGMTKLRKSLSKDSKAALKAAASDVDDSDRDEYKACLAAAENVSEIEYYRVAVMDAGIKFWAGSCLEGTEYEFQRDRSHGPFDYSLGKMLPMLSPYGYSLFVDKSTGPLQTLMRGLIAEKYPISLSLFPGKDGALSGVIVYDRIGEPINLSGTMNGTQLVLHELDASNTALSNIEVSWDGTKLTGSFMNLKAKKQMPFVATVVK